GAPPRPGRGDRFRSADGPGSRYGARRLYTPGAAVREAGPGPGAGAQPGAHAAVPGAVLAPEPAGAGRRPGAAGPEARSAGFGRDQREVRSDPRHGPGTVRDLGLARVQPRPLRAGD